jgi:hypothetical protein
LFCRKVVTSAIFTGFCGRPAVNRGRFVGTKVNYETRKKAKMTAETRLD